MNGQLEPTVLEIQAYRELECKNVSLDQFVRRKRQEKFENERQLVNYQQNLPRGLDKINNSVMEKPRTMERAVARCIIIDGANIMHCGSIYTDDRVNNISQSIPDVAALLSVLRFFVAHEFDVFAVISRKYAKRDATNFSTAIDELVKNDLCVITPTSNLDDTVALEFAAQTHGLVVTSDQFRDHMALSIRYQRLVAENRLGISWGPRLPEHQRNTQTKKGGHYIANRIFKFVNCNDADFTVEELTSKLYVMPDNINFEISKERYELSEPKRKKEARLALLNRLIMEALSVCQNNAEEILRQPVHDPEEARRLAQERRAEIERELEQNGNENGEQDHLYAEIEQMDDDEW